MSDVQQPTYRFKWSNYDLDRYLRERRRCADALRREAEILTKRAEQVDKEADELEAVLLPATSPETAA